MTSSIKESPEPTPTAEGPGASPGWIGNVVLLLLSIGLSLFVMEMGLRVYQRVANGVPVFSFLPQFRHTAFQRSPFLVFGPRVNWSAGQGENPEWTTFNELGVRLPGPVPMKAPGEYRIVALGGSTTENVWNDLGIHWPLALECQLRDRGRSDVRVLNAGMSAYSTAHSLVRFQLDLVELQADAVMVMHNINDLTVVYDAALRQRDVDPNYAAKYTRKSYTSYVTEEDIVVSRLARLIRGRLDVLLSGLQPEPPAVPEADLERGVEIFRRNLTALVRAIEDAGAAPVLITMPRSEEERWVGLMRAGMGQVGISSLPEDPQRVFADFDRYNEAIRQVAAAEGTQLLDQAISRVWEPGHFVDLVHYSTDGIRVFGREAADRFAEFLPERIGTPGLASVVSCDGVY